MFFISNLNILIRLTVHNIIIIKYIILKNINVSFYKITFVIRIIDKVIKIFYSFKSFNE